MPLWGRSDGTLVRGLSPVRRMMPYLMTTRTGATVTFDQHLDITATLALLAERNAGRPTDERISLLHVVLCAIVRTLAQRPRLNRFVVGRRIYQRSAIELSFAVKKAFTDQARMTMVKVRFEPDDDLEQVARRARDAIKTGRGDAPTDSEREVNLLTRLPGFLLRWLVSLATVADRLNLLPAAMIRADPLYCSVVLANLGSLGLDAAYHHLYEYGTATVFATVGRHREVNELQADGSIVQRRLLPLRYSFDERAADGLYCARSLQLFGDLVQHPEALLGPADAGGAPAAQR